MFLFHYCLYKVVAIMFKCCTDVQSYQCALDPQPEVSLDHLWSHIHFYLPFCPLFESKFYNPRPRFDLLFDVCVVALYSTDGLDYFAFVFLPLSSLVMIPSRSIQVTENCIISPFLRATKYSIVCIDMIKLLYLSLDI